MKNKHLVFLFLVTLLIGLAVRKAPWRNYTFFQTTLLKLDTLSVQQITVTRPAQPGIVFLRGDSGWTADQEERSVNIPTEFAQQMLAILADLQTIRIVKSQRPDTLGFSLSTAIQLRILSLNQSEESLGIGSEVMENGQAATYIQLPRHEGIYLVNKHLRSVFSKSLSDFRNSSIASFPMNKVRSFVVTGPKVDSLTFHKNDSTASWNSALDGRILSQEQVQNWFALIAGLKDLAYADLFDESHTDETYFGQIRLKIEGAPDPLILKFYQLNRINVPEDLPHHKPDRRQFAPFVLHSSQNPTNYFALPDTSLMRQLCHPF